MSILKAQSNEQLANHLHNEKTGIWNDWVVTTAFYSALHYVTGKLFPLPEGERDFVDVQAYNSNGQFRCKEKHETIKALVYHYLTDAYDSYRWLHSQSSIARYRDYGLRDEIADLAVQKLIDVKHQCS